VNGSTKAYTTKRASSNTAQSTTNLSASTQAALIFKVWPLFNRIWIVGEFFYSSTLSFLDLANAALVG